MPKAKKIKRNSGEAVEVGEPDPPSGTGPRKIPAENRNNLSDEVNGDCEENEDCAENGYTQEMYTHIVEDEDGGMRIGDIYIAPPPKPALTFDCTGPRMIITHIVITNFKSYAGVQHLGPFHKSFTSIIGPNGSGKSNVIDAMLFVFGYRATRIRSSKIGALIHHSQKFPDIKSASVEVHFAKIIDEEGDNFSLVPDSKIVVGRTGFKDNTSFYTLDGKRSQFKQVAKVLRKCGIDLDHNRFLILQGEVELISMMKPKAATVHESGMLEYLEDIIGTTRYKEPIEKINERVEFLTEARKEKLNRVRAVENEKSKLEQPMKEAVELVNLTNQALRIRNMMLQKYGHEVGKLIDTRKKTKATIEEKLASIDAKLGDVSKELDEKTAVLKEGSKKYELLHKKKESVKERLQSCKNKTVTLIDDTTQLNLKKKNLDQLLTKEKRALIELELIPEKNTREIAECEKLLVKVNENKRKADAELETVVVGVSTQTQSLRENQTRLKAKLIGLKEIVNEADESYNQAKNELDICTGTEQKETEKLAKMKEEYEKANKDLVEKKRIHQQLSSTLPENEKELTQLQSKLQDMRREEASVQRESVSLLSQVEASRQVMTANRSRGRVLDSLMREKQNGNIPGIFGRLGDLGGIDLKYDVAISTCCGALDNIVVDTVETAQACVEYLKKNDVGRATFIALNKQTHLKKHYERKQTFPENVPRMFNLITVKDERVLPAFYYALRDTLVANDLEQATRIAYGRTRYRMVTLKGEVIEIAGTMAGGGKSTMRGRMSSAVQQDTTEQDHSVIKANEKKLAALEQRLSELRSQIASVEDTMTTLQKTVQEGKRTLGNLNSELRSLTVQVPLIKDKIKQQEKKVSSSRVDEGRKELLESVVADEKGRLVKAQYDAGEVEKEIHEVDAQISAIAGGRIKDMQKKVNELAKKINKINTEMTKLKVAIDASIRNAQLSKDKIASMEADYTETEKTLENLGIQKKQLTLDTAELTKEMEEIEEEINEGTGEFSGLKKQISKLNNKQTEIKSERIVIANELSAEEKAIKDCEAKLPIWEREISDLKLEDAGEDDSGIAIPDLVVPEPLERHTPEELEAANVDELRAKYKLLKQRIGDEKPNIGAIKEYRAKEASFLERAAALESVTARRNELRTSHDNLRRKRQTEFLAGFNIITGKLKEMYQMITLGGDAELELVDSLDPFTEGIIFSVRPPNKSWKNISNLSGGEKTLSSLALVFALHYYRPTPLYVMDEIDAALDFKNVSIVANYIQDRTRNAQFVIISLRYIMFEACNRLVGIYKVQDCTRSVAVENEPVLEEATKSRDRHI